MGKYKDLVSKLPEEREIMEHLTIITDEFVESVRMAHPQKYNNFITEVQNISTKHHFNEEKLHEAYKHVGNHFNVEDTTRVAKEEFEIDFTKEAFNHYDFNFIMNEMYKTYCNVYQNETTRYAELALAWLDVHDGKVMKYYEKMYLE